jgi:hypothetical protein
LPQHEDLGFQRHARSDQIDDNPKNYSAEIQHPAEHHPILRLTPTGWNLRQGQSLKNMNGSHVTLVSRTLRLNRNWDRNRAMTIENESVSCGSEAH